MTRCAPAELCCEPKKDPAVTLTLSVVADGHQAKGRLGRAQVNPNDADDLLPDQQHQRMMARTGFVRVVAVVDSEATAPLKENVTADGMVRLPVRRGARRAKGVV